MKQTYRNFLAGMIMLVVLFGGILTTNVLLQQQTSQNVGAQTTNLNACGQDGGFCETFDGAPVSPVNFTQLGQNVWDVQVHSRNQDSWQTLPEIAAQHGHDCAAPPATHQNSTYEGSVFNCRNHLMTAIDGSAGYALISLVPNHTVDCTTSCTIQWEMSTERMSGRDWTDLWITPWADNITLPFSDQGADLQGPPKNGISIDTGNGQGAPVFSIVENGEEIFTNFFHGTWWPTMNEGIAEGTNQAATRQTFKFTVTPESVKFERLASATGQYIKFWEYKKGDVDGEGRVFPSLKVTNRDVVQFDQHSYTPFKDGAGVAATWHWDTVAFSPSTPFTMIKGDRRFVDGNGTVKFNSPAPANSWIRFSAMCKPRINGGPALVQQTFANDPGHFASYFAPVPEGFTQANITFEANGWYSGPCHARDFAIWSQTPGVGGTIPTATTIPGQPTSTPLPTALPTPIPTSTPRPTSTPIPTATPKPTATPTPRPTNTPVPTAVVPTTVSTNPAWVGQYYIYNKGDKSKGLNGTAILLRSDPTINFNWGLGSPASNIRSDRFSTRWTSRPTFAGGTYQFKTVSDDGIRVYLDGQLLSKISAWTDHGTTTKTQTINVTPGEHTIVVEYYENTGFATAQFSYTKVQ